VRSFEIAVPARSLMTCVSGLRSPRRSRGGEYTVAEQSAWLDEQCADLKFAADKANVVREVAQDRLQVLLAQAEIVRSLGASVRQAYELAGTVG
jgi:hypothetical protein